LDNDKRYTSSKPEETSGIFPPKSTLKTFSDEELILMDGIMTAKHKQGEFNGLIAVADHTGIRYAKGFGPANLHLGLKNNPDYTFSIASLTKQFVAAVILKLADQAKLKLEDDFFHYLPHYTQESWGGISIHHLLTHSSGIADYIGPLRIFGPLGAESTLFSPHDLIQSVKPLPLNFTPGQKFSYSNTNFVLLGLIIEMVTGLAYEEALDSYLFSPLKLQNTGVIKSERPENPKTLRYYWEGNQILPSKPINFSCAFAAGDMYSTLSDLVTWQKALDTGKVISMDSLTKMYTPYVRVEQFFKEYIGSSYGYSVFIKEIPSTENKRVKLIALGGYLPKATLVNYISFPEKNIQIISLENTLSLETTGKYFYPTEIIAMVTQTK
jgi:CubicO group peptidase (beta-lactamase class C family)